MSTYTQVSIALGMFFSMSCMAIVASQENAACGEQDLVDPPNCPPDGNGQATYLPYTYDCTKYFECSNGHAVCLKCPTGTIWDQNLRTCNHEHVTPCMIVTTSQPNSTTGTTENGNSTLTSQLPSTTTTTTRVTSTPNTTATTTKLTTPTTTTTTRTTSVTTQETSTVIPCDRKALPDATVPINTSLARRYLIDFEEDIPTNGIWNFTCPYALSKEDFYCKFFGTAPRCRGYWYACPPEPYCDISYIIQPGDSKIYLDAPVLIPSQSHVAVTVDNIDTWHYICDNDEYSVIRCLDWFIFPESSKKLTIRMFSFSNGNVPAALDRIEIH